jgi:pimeloyl-ACP methyl ester carboxylesterase
MRRRVVIRVLIVLLLIVLIVPFLIPLSDNGVDAASLTRGDDGRYIRVDGLQIYVVERGPADGPPIVLLHGFGGSTFSWRYLFEPLVTAGYHVVAFDIPPFGFSDKRSDHDYSQFADADLTAHVMDALGVQKAVMVGHSMGGNIIAYFALRYPERVEKLVFVDAAIGLLTGVSPIISSIISFAPVSRWAQIGVRSYFTEDRFAGVLKSAYYDPRFVTQDVLDGYDAPLKISAWDTGLLAFVRSNAGGNTLRMEDLATVNIPSWIAWGANDTWIPLSVGQQLSQTLPNTSLKTYPNVGHMTMEEVSDTFNGNLLQFLGNS